MLSAVQVLDNLIDDKKIPPIVTIFIDSTETRGEELRCSDTFGGIIVKELIPWVRDNYNISNNEEQAIIGGLSMDREIKKITFYITTLIMLISLSACNGPKDSGQVQLQHGKTTSADTKIQEIVKIGYGVEEALENGRTQNKENKMEKNTNDKSIYRKETGEDNTQSLQYLKNNDYDLRDCSDEEIKDYILTAEYLTDYLNQRDKNLNYGGKALGKIVSVWNGKTNECTWFESGGTYNTMKKVRELIGDYYVDKTIMYQLRRQHFRVFNDRLGVVYACGEGANFIEDRSKVKIIKNEEKLKEVEVQTFWDPGDGDAGNAIFTIELIDGNWKITNIKGFTVDEFIYDEDNERKISYIRWDRIYASSMLSENENDYNPYLMDDGRNDTAWVEGEKDDGIGEWIVFESDKEFLVSGIDIINGYAKTDELYYKNNRLKKVKVELSDGSTYIFNLEDNDDIYRYETMDFGAKRKINKVKIIILEVYKGSKYSDTCISEIRVW